MFLASFLILDCCVELKIADVFSFFCDLGMLCIERMIVLLLWSNFRIKFMFTFSELSVYDVSVFMIVLLVTLTASYVGQADMPCMVFSCWRLFH